METANLDFAGLEPFRPPFLRVVTTAPDCLELNMPLKALLYHVLAASLRSGETPISC